MSRGGTSGGGAADVVIVGGGAAGLAAALRLRRAAPGARVVLVEREPRLGGKIVTERDAGFVVEGGPDSFLSRKPRGPGLCRELGIAGRLIGRREEHRGSSVLHEGRLLPLPEGLSGVVPTDLEALSRTGLLSDEGRLRIAAEPEVPALAGADDESLASFFTRRLGREAWERLVEPLVTGIYGGSGDGTSLAATFPWLREMERAHGSLLRGLGAAAPPATAAQAGALPAFVSFPRGMAEIVEAAERGLAGCELLRGSAAVALERRPGGFAIELASSERIEVRCVLLAIPAPAAAELLEPLDAELASLLSEIRYSSSAVVSLAFDERSFPASGSGYLVPRAAGTRVMACTFASSKWPGRAPAGSALCRVFVGDDGGDRGVGDLVPEAREELRRTLAVTAAPLRAWVHRWPHALPQYRVGHLERVALIEERLPRLGGLFLAGASYRGLGVPDCILSGEQAADRAASALREELPVAAGGEAAS